MCTISNSITNVIAQNIVVYELTNGGSSVSEFLQDWKTGVKGFVLILLLAEQLGDFVTWLTITIWTPLLVFLKTLFSFRCVGIPDLTFVLFSLLGNSWCEYGGG